MHLPFLFKLYIVTNAHVLSVIRTLTPSEAEIPMIIPICDILLLLSLELPVPIVKSV